MPVIAGHRGAAGVAPENTLPAFLKAVELGVRLLELDVRLTRDGVPVCFHDERLDRVTPESGRIADWDWDRLATVPVMPGAFAAAYPDARIPRLSSVLAALPPDCRFLVELKADSERPEQLVRQTLEAIETAGALDRCRLISFDLDLLALVAQSGVRGQGSGVGAGDTSSPVPDPWPPAPIGMLVGRRGQEDLVERAGDIGAVALHLQHSLVDEGLVQAVRERGFLLNAWTVNSAEEAHRLALLGVDEITTDYPDLISGVLRGG
jgi:glycerophosphoryl diester phosphodiesterase